MPPRRRGGSGIVNGYVKPKHVFYGFVLGYVIGVRWNLSSTGGMGNQRMGEVVRRYLQHTCGDDQWARRPILDVIRDTRRSAIRDAARLEFPSLFPKGRQRPLQLPEELSGEEVVFDLDFINQLKVEVQQIKQELLMNTENAVETENAGTGSSTAKRTTTVVVPASVDLDSLTLDNFRELTGKRFRMTKDQRARQQAGTLTREQALAEFKASLRGATLEGQTDE